MSKVTVVGVPEREGQRIEWIGNRAAIQGVICSLYRVEYVDGVRQEFYSPSWSALVAWISAASVLVRSIRYCDIA